jgi:hypothetical protein
MRIKRILSSTYRSASDRSAPEWPEWALRYSARTPLGTGVVSDWPQRTERPTPVTPGHCPQCDETCAWGVRSMNLPILARHHSVGAALWLYEYLRDNTKPTDAEWPTRC